MILIIDNYDSFTYNLAQYVGELGHKPKVARNNQISLQEIQHLSPTHIIISPGPGHPKDSGISLEIIKNLSSRTPILGVCLGHQTIGYMYGSKITQLSKPIHGKTSKIYHNKKDLFLGLPNPFIATRYHSLVVSNINIPDELEITAQTSHGLIMAFKHKKNTMVRGIQFHPESLWTSYGKTIINNFLSDNLY